jgi:hypothetical protein
MSSVSAAESHETGRGLPVKLMAPPRESSAAIARRNGVRSLLEAKRIAVSSILDGTSDTYRSASTPRAKAPNTRRTR